MVKAWFIVRGTNRFGPYNDQVLASLAASGRLSPNDRVWCEGLTQPLLAADLPGLFPAATALPPPLPPAAAAAGALPSLSVAPAAAGYPAGSDSRCTGPVRRASARRSNDGLKLVAVVGVLGVAVMAVLVALLVREPSAKSRADRAAVRPGGPAPSQRGAEESAVPPPDTPAPTSGFDKQAVLKAMAGAAVAELIEGLPLGQQYDGELWESQLLERLVQGTRKIRQEAEIRGAAQVICDTFAQETRAFVTRPPVTEPPNPQVAAVDGGFQPERLLGMCREPFRGDTPVTEIAALPDNLCGMWWMHCKMTPGGVEIVPADIRRFASFMITAKAWQVANPGVAMEAKEFRGILRAPDVDGLPSYFVILSDDKQWVLHGPVEGRWILMRSFSDGKTEDGRSVFELKL